MDGKNDLFGWLVPDMDQDGDHDITDFLIYDDLVLSDDETAEHDTLDEDEDSFDEDFDSDFGINFDNDLNADQSSISEDDSDPFMCLEEEPDGDKVEDQKYQRELSKRYIAQRQNKARNIVRATQIGRYEPYDGELPAAQFVAENNCIASRYLSFFYHHFYLICSAVSDHFDLPFPIPAELNASKYQFLTLFRELAEDDLDRAMHIWDWCLDTFQPYLNYIEYKRDLTSDILSDKDYLPDQFPETVIKYMESHPEFVDKVIVNGVDLWRPIDLLIIIALERGNITLAKRIFGSFLLNKNTDIHSKILVISGLADNSRYYKNTEPLKLFQEHLFPMLYEQTDTRIKNKIPKWKKEIEERLKQNNW